MAETVAERIRLVRADTPQDMFAGQLGVHPQTIGKYERGLVVPGGDVLTRFRGLGISIDWLLTGEGEMRPSRQPTPSGDSPPATASLDNELVGLIVEGISMVYKEAGAALSPRELGRLIARFHTDTLAAVEGDDDPGTRRAVLRALLAQLRRDLRSSDASTQAKRPA